jgi:hypothetical protein
MAIECSICTQIILNNNCCVTECNHVYCLSCLLQHLKFNKNCPLCREKLIELPFSSDDESDDDESTINDPIINEQDVIDVKSYEYYGKITVNHNLKFVFIFLFITIQTNIIIFALGLSKN